MTRPNPKRSPPTPRATATLRLAVRTIARKKFALVTRLRVLPRQGGACRRRNSLRLREELRGSQDTRAWLARRKPSTARCVARPGYGARHTAHQFRRQATARRIAGRAKSPLWNSRGWLEVSAFSVRARPASECRTTLCRIALDPARREARPYIRLASPPHRIEADGQRRVSLRVTTVRRGSSSNRHRTCYVGRIQQFRDQPFLRTTVRSRGLSAGRRACAARDQSAAASCLRIRPADRSRKTLAFARCASSCEPARHVRQSTRRSDAAGA